MKCPHCGYEAGAGLRFCPSCGQALPTDAQATHIQVNQAVEAVETGGTVTGVSIRQVIGNVFIGADEKTEARRRRDLRILLDRVKEFWIDGVLRRSIQGAGLIELDKVLQPQAVEQPWQDVAPVSDALALPPDRTIAGVFEDVHGALLVLDGVGGGKTVCLLELAQEVMRRAEQDPLQPIPVVLNLSSWSRDRSIAGWAVEELTTRYQIPARVGNQWLEEGRLALLLDGLDQVRPEWLANCVSALNQFRAEHGLVPISVCCRTPVYEAAGARLNLSSAVLLQPLTAGQIEAYLAAAGAGAEALRAVLQEDEALRALARSPMMLNMMRLAYQDLPLDTLRSQALDTPEERRGLVLERYVSRMFEGAAGADAQHYSREQTCRWLGWLARGMTAHNESLFRIEGLQPSWLPGRARRWVYALLTRALAGLVLALGSVGWGFLLPGLRAPAWGYLLVGTVGGLIVGLVDALRFERREAPPLPGISWQAPAKQSPSRPEGGPAGAQSAPGSRRRTLDVLALVLCAAAVWGAIYLLRFTLGWVFGLKEGLMFGLVFGLILGVRSRVGGVERDTETVEALAWSPAGSLRGVLAGLGVSLLMAAADAAFAGFTMGWSTAPYSGGVFLSVFGPTLALIGAILGGLRGTLLQARTLPNQGMVLSARNALLVGGLVGLAGGLGEGLINVLLGQVLGVSSTGPGTVLVAGLFWAVVAALWYGGLDLIKHLVLRFLLWQSGHVPWSYAKFLDDTVDRHLLQRAGGGYLFANRLVQDYFAESTPLPASRT